MCAQNKMMTKRLLILLLISLSCVCVLCFPKRIHIGKTNANTVNNVNKMRYYIHHFRAFFITNFSVLKNVEKKSEFDSSSQISCPE